MSDAKILIVDDELDLRNLCRKIREVSTIPTLFLSAKSDKVDKILGLAIGGE